MKVLQKLHSFRKVSAFLGGKKTVKKEVNLDFFFLLMYHGLVQK